MRARTELETRYSPTTSETDDRTLAILAFHKIGEPPLGSWKTWFYVPEETFVGYLGYLREDGWQVIDLAALLRGLTEPETLPRRAALLTFDDGYRSMLDVALPWLARFEYPAVLFVPTDYIGCHNHFDSHREPEEEICDWDDLRELERWRVSVQSHGISHRAFSELDPAAQEKELSRSKVELEAGLGKSVEVFSYPYGDGGTDPQALCEVMHRIGYRAGCLYKGGPNRLPVSDPYRLTRIAMGPDSDLRAMLGNGVSE
jgi:peptidoglycan/xylan/chitin deacetylase (PgdA/CDA1 family)